jgi:hypothetical protein
LGAHALSDAEVEASIDRDDEGEFDWNKVWIGAIPDNPTSR